MCWSHRSALFTYLKTISSPCWLLGHCWNLTVPLFSPVFVTIADHLWPFLTIVDHCWPSLTVFIDGGVWFSYCWPKQEQHRLPQFCLQVCPGKNYRCLKCRKYCGKHIGWKEIEICTNMNKYKYVPARKRYIGSPQGSRRAVRHCLSHTRMAQAPSTCKSLQMIS